MGIKKYKKKKSVWWRRPGGGSPLQEIKRGLSMKKESLTTLGIALCILIAISVITAFAFSVFGIPSFLKRQNTQQPSSSNRLNISEPIIDKTTIRKGPDTAVMKIVEYSDFLCPACAQAAPIINELLATYPNDVQL